MNIYMYLTLLFGLSVSALLLGFHPVAWDYMNNILQFNSQSLGSLFDLLAQYFSDWSNIFVLALGGLVSGIVLRGNLSAIVPFMLLFLFAGLMVLPSGMFAVLGIIGMLFELSMKLIMLLSMVSFLRGY